MNWGSKELLELVAKVAGVEGEYCDEEPSLGLCVEGGYWHPLADDGDSFRLASNLEINIRFAPDEIWANGVQVSGFEEQDRNYYLRLAIFVAAVEVAETRYVVDGIAK